MNDVKDTESAARQGRSTCGVDMRLNFTVGAVSVAVAMLGGWVLYLLS
jgi:hypothetical protein